MVKLSFSKIAVLFLLCSSLIVPLNIYGQQGSANSDSIKYSLGFLASDSLRGRYSGTPEDSVAAFYIAEKMKQAGMVPLIGDSFILPFEITLYREAEASTSLKVSDSFLELSKDYYLHPLSPDAEVKGKVVDITADNLAEGDIAFIEITRDSINFITTRIKERGFKAIFYYDVDSNTRPVRMRGAGFALPVVSLGIHSASLFRNKSGVDVELESHTRIVRARTYNVAAITPGNNVDYVMVGAHYDHLGMGGTASGSLIPDTVAVHPGADDNASGVSSVLEIARLSAFNEARLAVVAFGAEELGLLGSGRLADTLMNIGFLPKIMMNLDMVGRLKDNKLQIGGLSTFEGADSLISGINNTEHNFILVKTQEGMGPSDHSSFYSKKVPVLYFTTGVHRDYHKPSDKSYLINFDGITRITNYITDIITVLDKSLSNLQYNKDAVSSPAQSRHRMDLKITLGIIPDFTYDKGDGFRIGPVNEGGIADESGMKEGDIITSIDGISVNNIYDYMSALGTLKKGKTIIVIVVRDGKSIDKFVNL